MRLRTPAVFVSVIALAAGVAFSLGGVVPAFADSVSGDANGLTFSADDSSPGDGAAVTGLEAGNASTDITIPSSVTIEGVSYEVTAIQQHAFDLVGLTSISIPDTVTSIGAYALDGEQLTSITIPDSVTDIGLGAFQGDSSVTGLTLGSGLTEIDGYAFYDLDVPAVTIPASVTIVGDNAFDGDTSLTDVVFAGNAPTTIDPENPDAPFGQNATVHYLPAFDSSQAGGEFTSDQWDGYTSRDDAVTAQFRLDGHGSAIDSVTEVAGNGVAQPVDPSAPGYSFQGWFMNAALTVPANFSAPLSQNTTFYAKWTRTSSLPPLPSNDSMYAMNCDEQAADGQVVKVDPASGDSLGDVTSANSNSVCLYGGAWDPENSTAYVQDTVSSGEPIDTIDLSSGATEFAFQPELEGSDVEIGDFAIGKDGTVYVTNNNQLYTVDIHSGAMTALRAPIPAGITLWNIAIDPTTGTLYGIDGHTGYLYRINETTGAPTLLNGASPVDFGAFGVESMQVDSSGQIWLEADTNAGSQSAVWSIDPSGWEPADRWLLTDNGADYDAEAFIIVAPPSAGHLAVTGISVSPLTIPAALSALGLGGFLVAMSRRRTRLRRSL